MLIYHFLSCKCNTAIAALVSFSVLFCLFFFHLVVCILFIKRTTFQIDWLDCRMDPTRGQPTENGFAIRDCFPHTASDYIPVSAHCPHRCTSLLTHTYLLTVVGFFVFGWVFCFCKFIKVIFCYSLFQFQQM